MKRLKKILFWFVGVIAFLVVLLYATGHGYILTGVQHTYFKGRTGPDIFDQHIFYNRTLEKSPETQRWSKDVQYNTYSLSAEEEKYFGQLGTTSILVIDQDSIAFEQYWEDVDTSIVSNSFSVAKSIVGLLVGIALDQGKIKSVDDPIGLYLEAFNTDKFKGLTIRHLLTMSSGSNWSESGGNPFSHNAKAYFGTDLKTLVSGLELVEEPGKKFLYQSGNTQILGWLIEEVSGTSVTAYAEEYLWKPLGAEYNALWNLDDEGGIEKAFCCFYATSRDYARLGKLLLDSGRCNGKQVVSWTYLREALQPADLVDAKTGLPNAKYGYTWWLEEYKGQEVWYARGILGQYVIVLPQEQKIVVRTGHQRGDKNKRGHPEDLYKLIDLGLEL